jgi:hypothetical protein
VRVGSDVPALESCVGIGRAGVMTLCVTFEADRVGGGLQELPPFPPPLVGPFRRSCSR